MNIYAEMSTRLVSIHMPNQLSRFWDDAVYFLTNNKLSQDEFDRLALDLKKVREIVNRTVANPLSRLCSGIQNAYKRGISASGKRDQTKWARKRNLGSSPMLPLDDEMRAHFTEGERSVLFIIIADTEKFGSCKDCVASLADRAGVGITTVRNTLRKAKDPAIGLLSVRHRPRPGQKHDTNIITVRAWTQADAAKLSRPRRIKPIGFNLAVTIEHKLIDIREAKEQKLSMEDRIKTMLSVTATKKFHFERI